MKKIILTSSGWLLGGVRGRLVEFLPEERPLRVAYIPAASVVVKDDAYARRDVVIMKELGFEVDEIDLAEVQGEELEARLRACRVVYVQGGNGFYLLKLARESGFLQIAKRLVEAGELIYVGKSVGSYLAGPSMEVHTWHSDKWRRFGVTDLQAMGLVDFLIQAHYTPDLEELLEAKVKGSEYDLKKITNNQFLVVTDEGVELVERGEV